MKTCLLFLLLFLVYPAHAQQSFRTDAPTIGTAHLASFAIKTANQDKSSDNTLADDNTLKFSALANKNYYFRFVIYFGGPPAADFKYALNYPTSPTSARTARHVIIPNASSFSTIAFLSGNISSTSITWTAVTDYGLMILEGQLANGANAGTVAFQWAQNTSDAGTTSVLAGSRVDWVLLN